MTDSTKTEKAMKAWNVTDKNGDVGMSFIVFAETRGKAISQVNHDGAFDWYSYTELRALREPALDRFYNGRGQMDWNDDEDRIAMVRYAGFRCPYEIDVDQERCEECAAHLWCERYKSMIGEDD